MKPSSLKDVLIFAAALLFAATFAHSQTTPGNPAQSNYPATVQTSNGAPSGNCPGTNVVTINIAAGNGTIYTCPTPGGSWVSQAGGTSSPTFTGTVTFPDGTTCTSGGCSINTTGSAATLSPSVPVLWTGFGTGNATVALAQNTVGCTGFVTGAYANTSTKVSFDVSVADNTANSYDLGISNATTGALVCHTGATAGTTLFPATGIITVNWTASCTLAANTKYFVTLTSSAVSPAAKLGANLTPSFQNGNSCGSSTSATIPNPLNTVPADFYAQTPMPALALHN